MTRGKLTAYAIVACFVAVITFLGVRSASGPSLFPGDKLETRSCRQCSGQGTTEIQEGKLETCPFCLGKKTCQVVIPGPSHPVSIRGSVVDVSAFKDRADAEFSATLELNEPKSLKPVKGAVGNAKLVFDSGSNKFELTSGATGRFHSALPPGEYQVSIEKSGFQTDHSKLVVPVKTQPIWQERAKMKTPDPDQVTFIGVLSK
jgi:hypothetical protein